MKERFPEINNVEYRDWRTLFKYLTSQIKQQHWKGPLIIDELPYLVAAANELPSVLQNWIDQDLKPLRFTLIIAGSSQSMMQSLVLNGNSPLYGRATDIIKLSPLAPKHLETALGLHSALDQVKAYTVWGGIPQYWELAENYGKYIDEAAHDLLLSPEGLLNQEPNKLLLEEKPTAISLRPILDVIGMGAHRLSEIAGRLGTSSTSLSKGLHRLQELDLIEREIPFGEPEIAGKKSLYKIKDPLFRLWFELLSGRQGQIAGLPKVDRMKLLATHMPHLMGTLWEELCRRAFVNIPQRIKESWLPPMPYWHGKGPEWDLVTTSLDKHSLIIGECKWFTGKTTPNLIKKTFHDLLQKGIPTLSRTPFKSINYFLFIPEIPKEKIDLEHNIHLVDTKTVIQSIQ